MGVIGLLHDGRWNDRGRPITYCSTGPALCVLEKLVHIEDASLIPDDTVLVRYEVPDDLRVEDSPLEALPEAWRMDVRLTRSIGNAWLDGGSACLLRVPSAVVPIPDANDRYLIVNHRHADAARITVCANREVRLRPEAVRVRVRRSSPPAPARERGFAERRARLAPPTPAPVRGATGSGSTCRWRPDRRADCGYRSASSRSHGRRGCARAVCRAPRCRCAACLRALPG